MSIASAIVAKQQQIADCYTAISNKGGTLPATQNITNMPTAINSISSGGGGATKYGASIDTILGDVDANSVLQPANVQSDLVFTGVQKITQDYMLAYKFCKTGVKSASFPALTEVSGNYGMMDCFRGCTNLQTISFPNLATVSNSRVMYECFYGCPGITTASFPELVNISDNGLYGIFYNCSGITSASFPKLTTIANYGMSHCFYYCRNLTTASFPELTNVGQNGFDYGFSHCKLTTIEFTKLKTLSGSNALNSCLNSCTNLTTARFTMLDDMAVTSAMSRCFYGCTSITDIYFNALKTTSFGSLTNQFTSMMSNTGTGTTHTIHFPSNLQSTISRLSGYPLFSGTRGYVTLSFDLPATS